MFRAVHDMRPGKATESTEHTDCGYLFLRFSRKSTFQIAELFANVIR
jgi:hypothetical protein